MNHKAFIDETGTDAQSHIFSISALIINDFNIDELVTTLKKRHSFNKKIKWTKVHKNTPGLINLGIDLIHNILTNENLCFNIIVVKKSLYNNWNDKTNKEEAYHKVFAQLVGEFPKRYENDFDIFL